MKKIKIFSLAVGLLMMSLVNVNAQQVVGTAGNAVENSAGSLSWTIGEVATQTLKSTSLILTQGFHQTKLSVTGIDVPGIDPDISAYPNPTADKVNIKFGNVANPADWNLYLFDQNGKKLIDRKIDSDNSNISLGSFPSATYYVRIEGKDNQAKVFRIVKK